MALYIGQGDLRLSCCRRGPGKFHPYSELPWSSEELQCHGWTEETEGTGQAAVRRRVADRPSFCAGRLELHLARSRQARQVSVHMSHDRQSYLHSWPRVLAARWFSHELVVTVTEALQLAWGLVFPSPSLLIGSCSPSSLEGPCGHRFQG